MRASRYTSVLIVAPLIAAPAACGGGDDGSEDGDRERADRPAKVPSGWRTVRNRQAGFTIAAPRRWTARTKRRATLIRSRDRLVAVSVAADRGAAGRQTPPVSYARETLEELPGFEGSALPGRRRVRGSPYRSARIEGAGSLRTSRRPQRITVAVFHRPDQVTYAAVVFRNVRLVSPANERVIRRMLRSLRSGGPPQRSGRSG